MAGMVAGATGAVLTAIIMVFEMTWNYSAIVPVILTATVAYAVRQWLSPPSIYTLKLLRRGDLVPQGLQAWIIGARRARDVMSKDFTVAHGASGGPDDGRDRRGPATEASAGSSWTVRRSPTSWWNPRPTWSPSCARWRTARRGSPWSSRRGNGAGPGDVLGVIGDREVAALSRSTARLME